TVTITHKRYCPETALQVVLTNFEGFADAKICQGIEPCSGLLVLLDKPYFITTQQIQIQEIRLVRRNNYLTLGSRAGLQETLQELHHEYRMQAAVYFIDEKNCVACLQAMQGGYQVKESPRAIGCL